VLIASSAALSAGGLRIWLWMDEATSIGVASHRLTEIPTVLRHDGSPPLYYVLLHGWMALFGTSEVATHAFSLATSLVSIPVALWAGWSLFGRRVGWTFAALVAISPFLASSATQTRMYSLVTLLAIVATASFLHAFAFGRRGHRWAFAAALSLVLYTHNWGLWLAVGFVLALVPCALAAPDKRRFAIDAAAAFGLAFVAYLPWLPTLAFQAAHTGAPWSGRPLPRELLNAVDAVLADPHERVLLALLLVGGPAIWAILRHRHPSATPVLALGIVAGAPAMIGWGVAQVSPSWAPRYLAVVVPAMLLLAAVGLGQAGLRGSVVLVLILVLWVQPLSRLSGRRPAVRRDERSTVEPLARALGPGLGDGDLVVAMQMEEVPDLAYYLPHGLRYATAIGPVPDPGVVDWVDALGRMRTTTAASSLEPQIDRAPVGSKIVLVCAAPGTGSPAVPWFSLMASHCGEWSAALVTDARLELAVTAEPPPTPTDPGSAPPRPRQVLAFTKRSG